MIGLKRVKLDLLFETQMSFVPQKRLSEMPKVEPKRDLKKESIVEVMFLDITSIWGKWLKSPKKECRNIKGL